MKSSGEGEPRESERPLDEILFASPLVRIGAFRAPRQHPRFHDSGPIERCVFVFPRTAVWIRHEGEEAFVADPNVVTFYNRGQLYRRDPIADEGDRCEWFALAPDVVIEAVGCFQQAVEHRPERPFPFSHGLSDARLYLAQRLLVHDLVRGGPADCLRTEETCLELLGGVLAAAFGRRPATTALGSRGERARRDLAMAAAAILGHCCREDLGLADLASRLGVSPGHLCRAFRRTVGRPLHRYRDELRLRTALEEIGSARDLTDLALELGYSSHSHFTAAFRRAFGEVPSAVRRLLAEGTSIRSGFR